ncbi:MAG: sugar transferase [Patescibacteria group bacterium]|nr:sugar transferase [Patescibacteria group bacterium]
MKKSELAFNLLSIPVDALMLLLAEVASFYLRLQPSVISKPIIYQLSFGQFLGFAGYIIPILLLVFAFLGLYNLKGVRRLWQEISRVTVGISLGLLVIILLFFFDQSIFPSRFIILASWALGILFVVFGRVLIKLLQKLTFAKGFGLHRLVIINGDSGTAAVIEKIYSDKSLGFRVVKELPSGPGLIERLDGVYSQAGIDEILQANPGLSEEDNLKLVQFARNKGLAFAFVPNLFEVQKNAIETGNLGGFPVIVLKNTPLDGWGKVVKRMLDVVVAAVCLALTSPFFLLIAIAIKLDSPGRIIYAAMRGGRGRDFRFFKFRSMYSHLSVGEKYGGDEAEKVRQELWQKNDRGGKDAPFLKIKHDPRVTRVGRFLRRTKLDEIPQFWNVLIGDMSMVGPRAHVLDEVERYRSRYRRMFSIKPGIFGLSQIAQVSWPDLPFEEEIKLNTFYIENWSLWLDLKILTKSFWLLFFSKKPKEDY